jgi:hypothetical protein
VNKVFSSLIFSLLLLTTCVNSIGVEVVIGESHPWEEASGRRFWYTLVYQEEGVFEQIELPVGRRRFELLLPAGKTTILAAYPLGNGAPLGGAYQGGGRVELLYERGPLAEALHHLSKFYYKPLEVISFDYLAKIVLEEREEGDGFDWNYLAQEIANGNLRESSLKLFPLAEVTLVDLPPGYWISERRGYPSFYSFLDREVVLENLPPGISRYINLANQMELRIVVSPGELPFWHITPLDTLLMISDSAYQKLLENSY